MCVWVYECVVCVRMRSVLESELRVLGSGFMVAGVCGLGRFISELVLCV